ncbi:hypothetical protein PC9H_011057 [Pleurotus ostreatus]|uniref:Protein-S-isoprenylcysteine O-methyltransferase n=3 Tax=Pleurotus TaxID=5320 RepID=A0A8H7DRN6_PLEOS|nr:uncharacterized protein PC9H_011057 [Pleurotus ostreatus]KAF7422893.1 hypothetical protein PC9H_011057 [Pleurotus ostreatus]KAG9227259.1 hypothetical protein CCMSSC00406_0004202 [Pleurotus cornucopiae]KAJ8691141.1 hypothetical protein PTI98_010738 [Pleurotus ostreatus]
MNGLTPVIVELLLVVVTAASFNLVMTPPHAAVPKDQFAKQTLTDKTGRLQAILQRIFVGGVSSLHVATIIYSYRSTETHVVHPIPKTIIIGTVICLACASFRFWAFATLGRFFDFQVRIQEDHKLVTGGPYSYVRHPSYTGLFLMYIGVVMEVFSPGHWLRDYGLQSVIGRGVCCLWGLQTLVLFAGLWKRLDLEDAILRREFGKDWEDWARRVPSRLIPGIY